MKRLTLLLALILTGLWSASANEVTIGKLSITLPDSMERVDIKGREYAARAGNDLLMSVSSISLDGNDESKIDEKGDWLTYPFLKDAQLVKTEKEPWHDWVHKYRKNSYTYEKDGVQKNAYTYHMNANNHRYIILMTPYTDKGEELVDDIMNRGVRNKGWFLNAPGWWTIVFTILFIWMLFIMDPDEPYNLGAHLKWAIIALIVFSIIAYLTMRTNLEYFWSAFLVAAIIVVVVPPLRKPLGYILEHLEG